MASSAAHASSSTNATSVTCISRPSASGVPRRSRMARTPAHPIATSVTPRRQGRPNVSLMITPTSTPNRPLIASRIRRAERSLSSGRSAAWPRLTFDRSMPALAHTKPCLVSLMISSPRRRRMRTDSRSTIGLWLSGSVGSMSTIAPSALETIFWVTMTTSCCWSSTASQIMPAMSSPRPISGSPSIGKISRRIRRSLKRLGRQWRW